MTYMEFFGCTFLAFGPPLAMFTFTIARDPIKIIILIASAFFWLLSLLLSSLIWFLVVPLKNILAFGLIFSVFFQELFRYFLYIILRRAEVGLKKFTDEETQTICNKTILAYVSGLGFGIMSGAFALVNVLAAAVGPGTVGLKGGSDFFFVTSAATTAAFILLNTFWGVIAFAAFDNENYLQIAWVFGSHMFVSCLTLINRNEMYPETLILVFVILVITAGLAFYVAGGTLQSLRASLYCGPNGHIGN